ncbi:hypothetical protein ACQUQU_14930 [Thalassolituus sp. LLYu03]
MKTVKSIVNKVIRKQTAQSQNAAVCNYADNYYGDRVCVLAKSSR